MTETAAQKKGWQRKEPNPFVPNPFVPTAKPFRQQGDGDGLSKFLHTPPTSSEKERKKVKPNTAAVTLAGGIQRATAGDESEEEASISRTQFFQLTPERAMGVAFGLEESQPSPPPPQLVMQSPAAAQSPEVVLVEDEEAKEEIATVAYEDEEEGFREGRPADEEW